MKLFSLVFLLSLFFSFQSAEAKYCRSRKALSVAEQLATLDPQFDLDLINLELFPHTNVISGYEYEVEPAYTNGLYSRTDSWQIGVQGIPRLSWGERIRSTFSFGVKSRTEATFIRFFKDPCEAMLALPYSPRRIPLKAHKALGHHFKIGDYFLFRGSMGVVAGVDIFQMMGSLWGSTLSGNYLMEGNYQVHVVRINERQIRLKVIARRGNTLKGSMGIGYENEFNVFKIDRLNTQLERFVNTKPVKLQVYSEHSTIFMVDYLLDLTDPEIANAFEELLPQAKSFKNLNLLKEFKKGIDSDLLLDLSRLEEIYRKDYQNGRSGRLQRNLRSTSDQDAWGFGLDVGNRIIGFKINRSHSSANMSVPRADDFLDRYMLKSWEKKSESRFFYSWQKSKNSEGMRALFKADKDFKNFEPLNIVKFIHHKKNRFSYNNFKSLQLRLKKALPHEVFKEIPWEKWHQRAGQKFMNYGLRFEFLASSDAIFNTPPMSSKEIEILFKDHILSKGLTARDYFTDQKTVGPEEEVSSEEQFENSLRSLARTLEKVLDQNLTSAQRVEFLSKLRKNTLFASSGISFLATLYPDKLQRSSHLDLNISSNEARIDFSYGDEHLAELYKKILTIKSALDDDGIDLIREAESLSSSQKLIWTE